MLNDAPGGARRYQDEVPAVARACRLLERLTAADRPRALAELSRELGVSASSLLAILTTLRRAGLVSRDDDGRYRPGPGLAALGLAAARRGRLFERFATLADTLVDRFGESVVLWVRHEGGFVLAAAREGTQPLRFVPTPGVRRSAGETALRRLDGAAAIVEEELLAGVWSLAVRLPPEPDPARSLGGTGRTGACGAEDLAAIAVVGPVDRLRAPAIRAALVAISTGEAPPAAASSAGLSSAGSAVSAGGAERRPAAPWEQAGPIDADELDAFLRQSLIATLSYVAEDGFPATVPLWYLWDGAAFWLASRPGSEWAEHVCLDPRVSLAVSEAAPPLRRVLARGRVAEVNDPTGARRLAVEAQLAARYAGFEAVREPAGAGRGRLLTLVPERLIAWRGLLRYPKLPPDSDSSDAAPWRHLG